MSIVAAFVRVFTRATRAGLAARGLRCLPLAVAAAATSQPASPPLVEPAPTELVASLAALEPLVGTWDIEATWSWGQPLRARNVFERGIGGAVLECRTIVSDAGGPAYARYHTIYAWDAERETIVAHGFARDGQATEIELERIEDAAGPAFQTLAEQEGTTIRQRLELVDDDAYRWRVWSRAAEGDEPWEELMDGTWRRVGDGQEQASPRPIAADRFVAAGPEPRRLEKVVEIDAPVEAVYRAWSTAEGWRAVYDRPESAANIDLAIGGRYEWLFDGSVGSNGCQILSYVPNRMLSFSWNAPPQQAANREHRTWVVIETEPLGEDRTRLRLTHLGFGDGDAWDETYAYFDVAWENVLDGMGLKLGG